MTGISRRCAIAGSIGVLAMVTPSAANAGPLDDRHWSTLVAALRTAQARRQAAADQEEAAFNLFRELRATLPPAPSEPPSPCSDITSMTIGEIREATDAPANKAAWATWQEETEAWKAAERSLRQQVCGPSTAALDAAHDACGAALAAVLAHQPTSLTTLAEKIEIVHADNEGGELPASHFEHIVSDVRRLAVVGVA